jgi:hypothetical protein
MNKAFYDALKPGGELVVGDYSARPGAGTSVVQTLHRSDEALVTSVGVPKIRALYEATYFAGLRKAGMPEE